MSEKQETMWDALCKLDGEMVARLLTDYHGTQLLDEGFYEFLQAEEILEEEEGIAKAEFKKRGDNCDVKEDITFSKVYKDGEKYIYLRLSTTSGQEYLEHAMFQTFAKRWNIIRMLSM